MIGSGFANIFRIPELKRRILFTLGLLIVYRVGVQVPVPGVDGAALAAIFATAKGTLLGLVDMFSGGALERLSVFALGIMPYISASIILQLLTVVVPHLEQLKKEGEQGRKNQCAGREQPPDVHAQERRGKQAHGGENGEPAAHAVGHDEGAITFLCCQWAQAAFSDIGGGDDVLSITFLAQPVYHLCQGYDPRRSQNASLGLVTVYRTLEKLEELNLIQRVHQPQGCQAFIAAFTGHQHLILCKRCGKVEFFSGEDLDDFFMKIGCQTGYKVEEHWLQLFGVCSDCLP